MGVGVGGKFKWLIIENTGASWSSTVGPKASVL